MKEMHVFSFLIGMMWMALISLLGVVFSHYEGDLEGVYLYMIIVFSLFGTAVLISSFGGKDIR